MTLEYFKEIDDGELKFNMYTSSFEPLIQKYKPLYIINKDLIYYGGNTHFGANINNSIKYIMDMFLEVNSAKSLKPISKTYFLNYAKNKKIYNDYGKLDFVEVRKYINHLYYHGNFDGEYDCNLGEGFYTRETMEYINTIVKSFAVLAERTLDIYSRSTNSKELMESFLDIKKIDKNSLDKFDVFSILYVEVSNIYSVLLNDFVVQCLDFDKVETNLNKSITTSKNNIYEHFFNYFLMDFGVQQLPKLVFNQEKNVFEEYNSFSNHKENLYKEEIDLIRKHVKKEDRYKHFI